MVMQVIIVYNFVEFQTKKWFHYMSITYSFTQKKWTKPWRFQITTLINGSLQSITSAHYHMYLQP
jgi:hypothetical protein